MEARILEQDKLLEFVDALVQDHEVIAPVSEGSSGGLSYGKIGSAADMVYPRDAGPADAGRAPKNLPNPSKSSFFPSAKCCSSTN